MDSQLELYIKHGEELKNQLKELLDEEKDAGAEVIGSYRNRIKRIERLIAENEEKIRLHTEKNQNKPPQTIYIYIITSTNYKIKTVMGDDLFAVLYPQNHDDKEQYSWKPFTKENISIRELLDELKNHYQFTERYLDGMQAIEQLVEIDINIPNSIAIVDLLALDEDNRNIAKLFNRGDVCRVITPICSYVDNKIKDFMIDMRGKIFSLLRYYSQSGTFDGFRASTSEKDDFIMILREAFRKNQPSYNYISDKSNPQNNRLRNISNSSF